MICAKRALSNRKSHRNSQEEELLVMMLVLVNVPKGVVVERCPFS